MQVRCPKCRWEPQDDAEWTCESCGYEWNMFESAGRCPQCKYQHETTYCIEWQGGCGEVSPHLDWYGDMDQAFAQINIFKSGD